MSFKLRDDAVCLVRAVLVVELLVVQARYAGNVVTSKG